MKPNRSTTVERKSYVEKIKMKRKILALIPNNYMRCHPSQDFLK
jgi:hypothetical protein